jgi:dienelactone hydrolase
MFPLLLLAPAGDRAAQDTVLARYFASHAYVVVAIPYAGDMMAGLEAALEVVGVLPLVDSQRIAVAGTGDGAVAARRFAQAVGRVGALVELRPVDGGSVGTPADRIPTLVLRTPPVEAAPVTSRRLTVDLPPGPSDHFRLVASVTHAFLNAALGRGSLSLTDLTRRLRADGLGACCASGRD